jgi:hypothetical protein
MFFQGTIFGIIVGAIIGSLCVYANNLYNIKVSSKDSVKILAEDFCGNADCKRIIKETLKHSPYGVE